MERIVLGHSGGLDTSITISWLAGRSVAEVGAVMLDLGQGRELFDVRERALAIGAMRAGGVTVRQAVARVDVRSGRQARALHLVRSVSRNDG